MKKITKQLLIGVVALGLMAPIVSTPLNPIKTTVNAKRRHHKSRRYHHRRFNYYRAGINLERYSRGSHQVRALNLIFWKVVHSRGRNRSSFINGIHKYMKKVDPEEYKDRNRYSDYTDSAISLALLYSRQHSRIAKRAVYDCFHSDNAYANSKYYHNKVYRNAWIKADMITYPGMPENYHDAKDEYNFDNGEGY